MWPRCEVVIADYDPEKTRETFMAISRLTLPEFAGKIKWVDVYKSGIGIARHLACKAAAGEIIVNFDADCRFERPDGIEKMVLALQDQKLAHCPNEIKPEERQTDLKASSGDILYQSRNILHEAGMPFPYEPGLTLRKETYEEIGGFRDVVMLEGPLLGFDATLKYGLGAIKFVQDVKVMVSARRFIGSGALLDLNYGNAYR